MNIAMYIPLAFFAVTLFRRPALISAGCIVLSAATELTQAVTPHIGRSCTSEDLVANSLGAVIGAAAAALIQKRREADDARFKIFNKQDLSRAAVTLLGGAAVALSIGSIAVTTVLTEVSELTQASSAQQEKARKMVNEIYGEKVKISSIQHMKGEGDQADQTLVTLEDGFLNFTESGNFVTGSTLAKSLPGVENQRLKSDDDAIQQAESFVRGRFPWALAGSQPMVDPTAPGTGQKTVGWRKRVEGVLMPMRMDVVVEPDGRISAFTGRNEPGPATPPAHALTAAQARKIATEKVPNGKFDSSEILVQKNEAGDWETRWAVNFMLPAVESTAEEVPVGQQVASVMIHANTGTVIDVNYGEIPN